MPAGAEGFVGDRLELREVLDALPVGVVAFTPDGVIAFINQQAADWLGLSVAEAEGEHIDSDGWEILNPDGSEMAPEDYALSKVLATGESVIDDRARLRVASGREFDIATSARPLYDDGSLEFVVGTFEDISETRTHESRLVASNHQLDALASVLSHDLRSPLTVATGYLDLARETGDLAHLDRVERAHDRMRELIGDLLRLARSGEEVGERVELDLATVAEDAWKNVETGDARLVTASVTVNGDRNRLTQLFENLFRNSVEHSSTGCRTGSDNSVEHSSTSPRSQAHEDAVEHSYTDRRTQSGDAFEHSEHAGEALTVRVGPLDGGFYVEDDGPGLPEAVREAVEDGRLDELSGLGLRIVTSIATGHGWRVTATEGRDGGARFEFLQ
ncbi:PAS domain-containing protein [Natronomonas sp. EA1]|uniref:PAS domain-containing protein n=1 Tax=Natronomonas sp. EA1 TaxID=3421655 RepID=UPI003EBA05D9